MAFQAKKNLSHEIGVTSYLCSLKGQKLWRTFVFLSSEGTNEKRANAWQQEIQQIQKDVHSFILHGRKMSSDWAVRISEYQWKKNPWNLKVLDFWSKTRRLGRVSLWKVVKRQCVLQSCCLWQIWWVALRWKSMSRIYTISIQIAIANKNHAGALNFV